MTSLLKLLFSVFLFLSLIQLGHAKSSTEDLIVEKSDIFEIEESTEIKEGDFFEDVQTRSDDFVWIVNLKNGPYSSQKKAKQVAEDLKKTLDLSQGIFLQKKSLLREPNFFENKKTSLDDFSWIVNLRLGPYDSKIKALQIAEKLKTNQGSTDNIFLTRETISDEVPRPME